jgi:endonuclease/exonuclease/phosphatase family metal-dependent hydrolase
VTGTVRLMTANLLYKDGVAASALADAIETVDPDLLAVQELTPALIPTIEDHFLRLYATTAELAVGMAASRPVGWRELPMPLRPGVVATLDPSLWPEFAGPVEIVAVHLRNPIGGMPWSTTRDRVGQIEAVERLIEGSPVTRRVVCGDLNATPRWPAYRRLTRSLRDGIGDASHAPPPTWAPRRITRPLLRIDHVLVSGIRVVASRTVRIDGSDHDAVVADLAEAG